MASINYAKYAKSLLRGLLSCVEEADGDGKYTSNDFKYSFLIKWIEHFDKPRLLVKAETRFLTKIMFELLGNPLSYEEIKEKKYKDNTRKVIDFLKLNLRILYDLRFNPQKEKTLFFSLDLWSCDDLNKNLDEFDLLCEENNNQDIFSSPHIFQYILDAIPLPIFFKDANGLYKGCNKQFQDFLGRDFDRIIKRPVDAVSLPKEAFIYEQKDLELFQAFPNKKFQIYRGPVKNADSQYREVIFYKGNFPNIKGNRVGGLVGVMLDVTSSSSNKITIDNLIKQIPESEILEDS